MRGVARRLYQEYIQHRRRKRCRVSGRGLRDERALHSQSNPLGVENMCFLVFFQPWKYATVNPIPGIPFIISPSFFQKSFSLPFLHTHTHTYLVLLYSLSLSYISLLSYVKCECLFIIYVIVRVCFSHTRFCWKQHYVALVVWSVCALYMCCYQSFGSVTYNPEYNNPPENTRIFKC